jgi:hypothetical protein
MVLVSLRDGTRGRTADAELLAMHAPEGLGLRLEADQEAVMGSGARA